MPGNLLTTVQNAPLFSGKNAAWGYDKDHPDPDTWMRFVQNTSERVDGRAGLEMQITSPIRAAEHVPEESLDIVDVELRLVLFGGDPKVFGQRQLPLPQDARPQ